VNINLEQRSSKAACYVQIKSQAAICDAPSAWGLGKGQQLPTVKKKKKKKKHVMEYYTQGLRFYET